MGWVFPGSVVVVVLLRSCVAEAAGGVACSSGSRPARRCIRRSRVLGRSIRPSFESSLRFGVRGQGRGDRGRGGLKAPGFEPECGRHAEGVHPPGASVSTGTAKKPRSRGGGVGAAGWGRDIGAMTRPKIATAAGLLFVVAYVVAVVSLPDLFPRLHWVLEALYWLVVGVVWVFPIRWLMMWAVGKR